MKIAASNIAWKPKHRMKAYDLLAKYNFSGIEIAPSLF